jgi:hypothetical protein
LGWQQPARGWDYNGSLALLAAQPTTSPLQLGTSLADGCGTTPNSHNSLDYLKPLGYLPF